MGLDTPTPWRTIQGSRVLAFGRRLWVLVLGGVLILTPSTLVHITFRTQHPLEDTNIHEACESYLLHSHILQLLLMTSTH